MLVELVDQADVRTRTRLAFISGDRPKETVRRRMVEIPDLVVAAGLLEMLLQLRRLIDHRHRVAEKDHRLIALRRGGIDLGARFAVCGQAVEPDAGEQRRLAVALALLDVGKAKASRPVGSEPAEQRADDEGLRDVELERQALELAAIEAQHARKESKRARRGLFVEPQSALVRVLEIAQMPCAGVANVRPRDDRAGDYLARVVVDDARYGGVIDLRTRGTRRLRRSRRPDSLRLYRGWHQSSRSGRASVRTRA